MPRNDIEGEDRKENDIYKHETGFKKPINIVTTNFVYLIKTNFLLFMCILPTVVFYLLATECNGVMFLLFLLCGSVTSILVGPAITATYRLLGDVWLERQGKVWQRFKKSFKDSWHESRFIGIVYSLILYFQYFTFATLFLVPEHAAPSLAVTIMFMLSVLLFSMLTPYLFLQMAYLNIGIGKKVTNSVLMALANGPRSLLGVAFGGGLLLAQAVFLLFTLPITLFIGLAFPIFLNIVCIWRPFNTVFQVETLLQEMDKKE